jgi:hypothetical protein
MSRLTGGTLQEITGTIREYQQTYKMYMEVMEKRHKKLMEDIEEILKRDEESDES